jgi:SnoaL-like domain
LHDIRHSWSQIFNDSLPRTFAIRGRIVSGETTHRIHTLEENISVPGTSFRAPPVLATNIYRRLPDGWRMVMHHASVSPVSLGETDPSPGARGKADPRLH